MAPPPRRPDPLGDRPPEDRPPGESVGDEAREPSDDWQPRPNDFLVEPMFAPFGDAPETGSPELESAEPESTSAVAPKADDAGGLPEAGEHRAARGGRRAWWRVLWDRMRGVGRD